ncbi:MAG: hypothetical protein HOF74_01880 [Gammaproteobacteria bacterium]|jgi:signal transduction histidine kinase|nr:hypothetical protein [Gammaproteobacteria bacterium]MBT3858558.1 hypothetical protein [Gammaproteobacteria bacterium]MBT3986704.1 hypothetical protein [Gammaproteobacteria bacterium]MBT4582800.1 hypothetical protein [Gammaproteobacteria bacterium]MBT4657523.1 hypothetical protein [Gammaproteobacteria bacterium]
MPLKDYINSDYALNASGILVTLLVGSLSIYSSQDSNILPLVSFLAVAQLFCFSFFLASTDDHPLRLRVLFWIEAVLIIALHFVINNSFAGILSIIWIVQSAELYGPRRSSWLLAASLMVLVGSQFYHLGGGRLIDIAATSLSFGLFMVFALSAVSRSIRERELREEARALNNELIATRELLSQSAAQSERVRIARDLHDILGHHMTALILNLEVAKHKAEGEAQEKVEQSLAMAKLLLGDLRTTVSELREDDIIELEQSIRQLIAGIPKPQITLDFSNAPTIRNVELAEILLRCTQEAITNVLRHSKASHCRIELREHDNKCILTIEDNGILTLPKASNKATIADNAVVPGNGLTGMKERIKMNDGLLSFQRTKKGFQVMVELKMDVTQ